MYVAISMTISDVGSAAIASLSNPVTDWAEDLVPPSRQLRIPTIDDSAVWRI